MISGMGEYSIQPEGLTEHGKDNVVVYANRVRAAVLKHREQDAFLGTTYAQRRELAYKDPELRLVEQAVVNAARDGKKVIICGPEQDTGEFSANSRLVRMLLSEAIPYEIVPDEEKQTA